MKKAIMVGLAVLLGIGVVSYAVADPRHGSGFGMGYGSGWMHSGGGYGPGSMHRGFGPGPGFARGMGNGPGAGHCWETAGVATGEKLTQERAEAIVKQRLAFIGNPNLKLGEVKEEDGSFVADITTKDGSLVDRLRIDKQTGFLRPVR